MKQIMNKTVYEHIYYLHLVLWLNCVRIPQTHIGGHIGNADSWLA